MPGVVALLGVLAYNYSRFKRGRPTICATVRRVLPRPVMVVALGGVFCTLLVHLWNGYAARKP